MLAVHNLEIHALRAGVLARVHVAVWVPAVSWLAESWTEIWKCCVVWMTIDLVLLELGMTNFQLIAQCNSILEHETRILISRMSSSDMYWIAQTSTCLSHRPIPALSRTHRSACFMSPASACTSAIVFNAFGMCQNRTPNPFYRHLISL